MNLSQDEINALTAESAAEESGAESVDIMSPEDIAAMLEEAALADTGAPDVPADDAGGDAGGGDIMSPEDIAAMLADAEGLSAAEPEAQAAPTDSAGPFTDNLALEGMLTAEEIDILGEVGNISMGAVATTMYSLLDRKVSITTPRVSVFQSKDVLSVYKVPFVVATIEYTRGIEGTNLLVLKVEDAAMITDILMGGDGTVEEPIELNEMHLSAMSEIMNQMMGASSTSLSKMLGKAIDIAPPNSSTVDAGFDVSTILGDLDKVTKITFDMEVEGLLKSELIQITPYEASRQFAKQFMKTDAATEAAEAPKQAAPPPAPAPAAAPAAAAPPPAPAPAPAAAAPPPPPAPAPQAAAPPQPYQAVPPVDPYGQAAPYGYPPAYPPYPMPGYGAPQPMAPPVPMTGQGREVNVHAATFQSFDTPTPAGEAGNIGLVYNIPLQVSVELGKTKKDISEILEFSLGTIIVLDKIAGDPVEVVVNGKLLARGEVVVIDDNYGVRITDIVNV